MNLQKKKSLAARTFGVGTDRIEFNPERLSEIKEAITRQDLRDLLAGKAISIRQAQGRRKKERRATRRRFGSIKKKITEKKIHYVKLTRKLRTYVAELRKQEKISPVQHKKLKKDIRVGLFRSKSHLKENI